MRSRWMAALLAAFLLVPSVSFAAPSGRDRANARTAWAKGKRLAAQAHHETAIEELRKAVELDPKAQYQLDLARELVATRSLIEASVILDEVVVTEEPNTARIKQAAEVLLADLGNRIPTLKIELEPEGSDAVATVNGEQVEVGRELPYDPGTYTVKAIADDDHKKTEKVVLQEKQHRVVKLKVGARRPTKVAQDEEESSGGGNMAPAAVAYGIGGASLIAGGVVGFLAFEETARVEELCGGTVCPPEYADDVQSAQDYGTASTILFAVGGIGAAAGIILTVTVGIGGGSDDDDDDKKKKKKKSSDDEAVWVRPYVSPFGAGVVGTF